MIARWLFAIYGRRKARGNTSSEAVNVRWVVTFYSWMGTNGGGGLLLEDVF